MQVPLDQEGASQVAYCDLRPIECVAADRSKHCKAGSFGHQNMMCFLSQYANAMQQGSSFGIMFQRNKNCDREIRKLGKCRAVVNLVETVRVAVVPGFDTCRYHRA